MEFIPGLISSAESNGRPLLCLFLLSQHGQSEETWESSDPAHDVKSVTLGKAERLLCISIPKLNDFTVVVTLYVKRNLFIITVFFELLKYSPHLIFQTDFSHLYNAPNRISMLYYIYLFDFIMLQKKNNGERGLQRARYFTVHLHLRQKAADSSCC